MKRPFVVLIVFVSAVTWIVVAVVKGFPNTFLEGISPFFTAVPVATLLAIFYQRMLWHYRPVQQVLARVPDLRGAWEVMIRPAWVDASTDKQAVAVKGYAQIDQTASTFCMRLFTKDSRSETFAFFVDEIENEFRLTLVYENSPRMVDRARKGTSHQGSAIYRFRGYRPVAVKGEYWTETKNTGEIELSSRLSQEISSFDDGIRAFT